MEPTNNEPTKVIVETKLILVEPKVLEEISGQYKEISGQLNEIKEIIKQKDKQIECANELIQQLIKTLIKCKTSKTSGPEDNGSVVESLESSSGPGSEQITMEFRDDDDETKTNETATKPNETNEPVKITSTPSETKPITIKKHDEFKYKLTGKTYDIRHHIKLSGGSWDDSNKVWMIKNEHLENLKKVLIDNKINFNAGF